MFDGIIIIAGPTCCGKTQIALELALKLIESRIPAEIINADSMQVYNELKILTAQPTAEQLNQVPHNMYSVISPEQNMNVVVWNKMATAIIDDLRANGVVPIIVGGTGFYINSLIDGVPQIPSITPEIREYARKTLEIYGRDEFYKRLLRIDYRIEDRISKNDTHRILRAFEVYKATGKSILSFSEKVCSDKPRKMALFVLSIERNVNIIRIDNRLHEMIKHGVISEIDAYNNKFAHIESPLNRALGYNEFCTYINGDISLEDAIYRSNISIRQYAKRQVTWFKNKLPQGVKINADKDASAKIYSSIILS